MFGIEFIELVDRHQSDIPLELVAACGSLDLLRPVSEILEICTTGIFVRDWTVTSGRLGIMSPCRIITLPVENLYSGEMLGQRVGFNSIRRSDSQALRLSCTLVLRGMYDSIREGITARLGAGRVAGLGWVCFGTGMLLLGCDSLPGDGRDPCLSTSNSTRKDRSSSECGVFATEVRLGWLASFGQSGCDWPRRPYLESRIFKLERAADERGLTSFFQISWEITEALGIRMNGEMNVGMLYRVGSEEDGHRAGRFG